MNKPNLVSQNVDEVEKVAQLVEPQSTGPSFDRTICWYSYITIQTQHSRTLEVDSWNAPSVVRLHRNTPGAALSIVQSRSRTFFPSPDLGPDSRHHLGVTSLEPRSRLVFSDYRRRVVDNRRWIHAALPSVIYGPPWALCCLATHFFLLFQITVRSWICLIDYFLGNTPLDHPENPLLRPLFYRPWLSVWVPKR